MAVDPDELEVSLPAADTVDGYRPLFVRLANGSVVKGDRLGWCYVSFLEPRNVWQVVLSESRGRDSQRHIYSECGSEDAARDVLDGLMTRVARVVH